MLINAPTWNYGCQPAGFFVHWTDTNTGELNEIEFNFCVKQVDDMNNAYDIWFRLLIKPDVINCLKKCGRLPKPLISDYLEEIKENNRLRTKLENMKKFAKGAGLLKTLKE